MEELYVEEEAAALDVVVLEGKPDARGGQERNLGCVFLDLLGQHGDGVGRVPILVELPLFLCSRQKRVPLAARLVVQGLHRGNRLCRPVQEPEDLLTMGLSRGCVLWRQDHFRRGDYTRSRTPCSVRMPVHTHPACYPH